MHKHHKSLLQLVFKAWRAYASSTDRWPNFGRKKKKAHTQRDRSGPWAYLEKIKLERKTHPMRQKRRVITESRGSSLWAAASSPEKEWNGRQESERERSAAHAQPADLPARDRFEGRRWILWRESETRVNRSRGWWWQWSMQNFSPMYTGKIGSWGPITTDLLRYRYGCPWRKKDEQRARLLTSACCGRDACFYLLIQNNKKIIIAVGFYMTSDAQPSRRWVAPGIGIACTSI